MVCGVAAQTSKIAGEIMSSFVVLCIRQYRYPSPNSPDHSLQSSRWFLIGLIWVSIGMFDASDTVFSMRAEGHHHAWFSLFITLLLSWLPWALATPLILELGRRHPIGFTSLSGWLPHLGACTLIGLGFAAWSAALEELLNPWLQAPAPDPFARLMIAKFFNRFVSFQQFEWHCCPDP